MIDYQYLVQAITDWKAGKRPGTTLLPGDAGAMHQDSHSTGGEEMSAYEDVDSGLVMMDEAEAPAAEGYEQAQGYGEAPVEEFAREDRTQAYVPEEYDPANVAGGGEAPAHLSPAHEGEQEYEQYEQYEQQGYEEHSAVEADEEVYDVEPDVEEDDGEQGRDYDLEAVDDFANFDLQNDLAAWFVADKQIEAAWEDDAQRPQVLAQYGIRDTQHYFQVRASVERYIQSPDAEARWGGIDDIMQLQMNAIMDAQRQIMQDRAQGELAGELEPVEGISLQQWAWAQASVASGGDVEGIIAQLGIDQETWDRVSAEWNARMSRDTTATIATEYGKAFSGAGQGQYGAAGQAGAAAMDGGDVEGEPPIPFERWVEIEVAQSAGAEQGQDPIEILQSFGMTPADWGNVSAWWSQYLNRHMMENNQELFHRYSQLQEHYRAQYGAGEADEDIDY